MQVAALLLAAGRGERLGSKIPKAFVELLGEPLAARSLATLCRAPAVAWVVPVIPSGGESLWAALEVPDSATVSPPVPGGTERQDSVRAGLNALPPEAEWVAVHDAARCLVSADEVQAVIRAAEQTGAAILARPSADTIKLVGDGAIESTPERASCWVAQTPQVFRVDLLREALDKADAEGFVGTDDAQLVERLGVSVRVALGSTRNLKITTRDDLRVAEALLL